MRVDEVTYRKSISLLPDEELLERLRVGQFNDEAIKIAKSEVESRGLVVRIDDPVLVRQEELRSQEIGRSKRFTRILTAAMVVVAAPLGLLPGLVALGVGWVAARFIDQKVSSRWRGALGIILVSCTFLVTVVGRL